MKKAPPPEEKGETAPLWIISFADMISLLMAFFVMLLTMATPKSGALCNTGIDVFSKTVEGFNNAISDFGIPWLMKSSTGEIIPNDNYKGHPVSGNENNPMPDVLDGRQNETEMLFFALNKNAKTFKSPTEDRYPDFMIGPVMFDRGQTVLNTDGKNYLSKLSAELAESGNDETILYIVGLAFEEKDEHQKWITSANRAQTVSNYLKGNLPEEKKITIYSWGAASGGHWVDKEGFVSDQSQVLIAVLRQGQQF